MIEKVLFMLVKFESFKSATGSWAIPQPHNNGWIMPVGWEEELTARGISFTEIEITPEEDESLTLP